jgi:hypothetical protein
VTGWCEKTNNGFQKTVKTRIFQISTYVAFSDEKFLSFTKSKSPNLVTLATFWMCWFPFSN